MATVVDKKVEKDVRSLRAALAWLETQGDVLVSDEPVDPDLEITGLQKHLDGGPVLMFNHVKGKPHARVITNLFSDINVVDKMFGFTSPMDRTRKIATAMNRPLETSIRSLGIETRMSMPSGSSCHESLLGHHTAEPTPSLAVLIQCPPIGSFLNASASKRPISCGCPEY